MSSTCGRSFFRPKVLDVGLLGLGPSRSSNAICWPSHCCEGSACPGRGAGAAGHAGCEPQVEGFGGGFGGFGGGRERRIITGKTHSPIQLQHLTWF